MRVFFTRQSVAAFSIPSKAKAASLIARLAARWVKKCICARDAN